MVMFFCAGRAMLLGSAVSATAGAERDLEGLWRTPEEDASGAAAILRFTQVDGEYRAVIESIHTPQGKDAHWRCTACRGARRNQPLLNMEMVWGLKRRGLEYIDGFALDPDAGEIHRCSLTLAADGRQLRIRYYFGSSHDSVSEVWMRQL